MYKYVNGEALALILETIILLGYIFTSVFISIKLDNTKKLKRHKYRNIIRISIMSAVIIPFLTMGIIVVIFFYFPS